MFKISIIRLVFSILLLFTTSISHAAYTISADIDFGSVTRGSDLQPEITITNIGPNALQVGGIATSNPVVDPFQIIDVFGCANSFIQPGDQCSLMVLFKPVIGVVDNPATQNNEFVAETALGPHTDDFNIEIVNDGNGNGASHVTYLSGVVLFESPEPDVLLTFSSVDFGDLDVLDATNEPYYFPPLTSPLPYLLQNSGTSDLTIYSVTVTGATDVTVLGDCVGVIPATQYCAFRVGFKPLSVGDKNAKIIISSDDPDEPSFEIPIRGTALGENDGVLASIENAGPNNGDANFDETLDSKQSYVATLIDSAGNYVTYQIASGNRFNNMMILQPGSVPELPVAMASGIVDFTVDSITPGETIEVGILLPDNVKPDGYYMYGATVDNLSQHWSNFDFDGMTGAIYRGVVAFTNNSTSEVFNKNVLSLYVEDGGRGDADMTVNGVITVTGAASAMSSSSDGGGLISFWYLLGLIAILSVTRYFLRECSCND